MTNSFCIFGQILHQTSVQKLFSIFRGLRHSERHASKFNANPLPTSKQVLRSKQHLKAIILPTYPMTIEKGSIMRGASRLARLSTQGFSISTASYRLLERSFQLQTPLLFKSKPHPKALRVCKKSYSLKSESPIYSRKN